MPGGGSFVSMNYKVWATLPLDADADFNSWFAVPSGSGVRWLKLADDFIRLIDARRADERSAGVAIGGLPSQRHRSDIASMIGPISMVDGAGRASRARPSTGSMVAASRSALQRQWRRRRVRG